MLRSKFVLAVALLVVGVVACDDSSVVSDLGDLGGDLVVEQDGVEPDFGNQGDLNIEDSNATTDVVADAKDVEDDAGVDAFEPGPESLTLGGDDYSLVIDRATMTMTVYRDEDVLMTFDAASLLLGRVNELGEDYNYDPYPMASEPGIAQEPDGLAWLEITGMRIIPDGESKARIELTYGEKTATLNVDGGATGRFEFVLQPSAEGDPIGLFRIRPKVTQTEEFYGLGAYLDQTAHRGKVRAMQIEWANLESGYNEAHVPVPFVVGTTGWGLFVKSYSPAAFDCGVAVADRMDAWVGTGTFSASGITFYAFAAKTPLDVPMHYYAVTGFASVPARWGLGPLIWRDEIDGQAAVIEDLDTIRELKLPTTAYWIDRPYASGVNAFDFHPDKYDDPQAMIDYAHGAGFRLSLWHTPYVSEGSGGDKESSSTTEELHQYASERDFYVETVFSFNKWSDPIDLTNPEAYDWWQDNIKKYTDMGIEGFKLDYGEDIITGFAPGRVPATFYDGSDERTMHAKYQLFYHKAYAEMLPDGGGFLMCRGGTWGDQVNVSVIWPGDLDANFATHGEQREDDGGYIAVGGLPASVIYGLSLGMSGFPFFGADTGGYRHSGPGPDNETYMRWFQQTALSSVMQVGTSDNTVPWEFDEDKGISAVTLENYRVYASLHLRLWPYEWTYARQIEITGRPIQRPFGIVHPEIGVHPDDQYFFGDYLLVAPVVVDGQRERDVIFPSGRWMDWWDKTIIEGGSTLKVSAPLDKLPLYLAEGGIVPMLRPEIQALAPVNDPSIDSYATSAGLLYVTVFVGPANTFTLFDGTEISAVLDGDTLEISTADGSEFVSGSVVEIYGLPGEPLSVMMDSVSMLEAANPWELLAEESAWYWNSESGGFLSLLIPAGEHSITATF